MTTKVKRLTPLEELESLGACSDARQWVAEQGTLSRQKLWELCKDPSHMLWWMDKAGLPKEVFRLLAVEFASSVQDLLEEGESKTLILRYWDHVRQNGGRITDEALRDSASARASAWDSASARASARAWDSARASASASAWDSAWDSASARARDSAWDSAWVAHCATIRKLLPKVPKRK